MSASPASSETQFKCVQEIPVVTIPESLDADPGPDFASHTASLHNEPWARILLDLCAAAYLRCASQPSMFKLIQRTASCGGRTSLFSIPEPIMKLIGILEFKILLDLYSHPEVAFKGSAV